MMPQIEDATALLQSTHDAFLATSAKDAPYSSASGFIYEPSEGKHGKAYLYISKLAQHTRNLQFNPNVSLMAVEKNESLPIHERKRVTLEGVARVVEDADKVEKLKPAYLKAFPRADMYFVLPDFKFYEIDVSRIHYYGGYGRAESFE